MRTTLTCCGWSVRTRCISMTISCLYSTSVLIFINIPPVNAAATAGVTTSATKWWSVVECKQWTLHTRRTQVLWGQGNEVTKWQSRLYETTVVENFDPKKPARKETLKCEGTAPCWNSITFESVFLTTLSVAKLCRVAYKWTSTEQWGNDTDSRKQKQSEKNTSQWNFTLLQACAAVKLDLRSSGMLHSIDW